MATGYEHTYEASLNYAPLFSDAMMTSSMFSRSRRSWSVVSLCLDPHLPPLLHSRYAPKVLVSVGATLFPVK